MNQPHSGHYRLACNEPCEVDTAAGKRSAVVWNVSVLGVYVVLAAPTPERGQPVAVSFTLPGDPAPIRARARVAWRNLPASKPTIGGKAMSLPPGIGLEFVELPAADRKRIQARVDATFGKTGESRPSPRA